MNLVLKKSRLALVTIELETGVFSLVGNVWRSGQVVGIHCLDDPRQWVQFHTDCVKSIVFDPT